MKDALAVTLVQTALVWENKTANIEMLEQKIKNIAQPTEVVILPEMFSTGFSMNPAALAETMDGTTITWMKNMAAKERKIITGSLIIKDVDTNGQEKYWNRLVWVLPNGQLGFYDKRHLFAFAQEHRHYSAGNKRLIASVKNWKINLQVCYDLRFPVWARQTPQGPAQNAENLYDVLIYVANWPERRSNVWKTLLQARAIENQCYVIGVNRVGEDGAGIYHSGDSMVVSPLGDVLYHKRDEEDLFTITLSKTHLNEARSRFPFWKDADDFNILNS